MPAPLRRALLCLFVLALGLAAHRDLARAGFAAADLGLLAEVARAAHGDDAAFPGWFAGGTVRPLHAAALYVHARASEGLHPLEPESALGLRAMGLALLLAAGAGAGIALRRALAPWLGESAARAAGWATAGFTVAHPISVAAVASAAALGDLIALALVAWCAALFLRARQQRDGLLLGAAALLAAAAGFASASAWLLPPLVALLERTSARRTRTHGERRRAALLAFAVALACVALEPLRAGAADLPARGLGQLAAHAWGQRALVAIESLGEVLASAPLGGSAWIYVVAGAILLFALEPLLRAARAAPRLWGWLVLLWLAALFSALLLGPEAPAPAGRAAQAAQQAVLWPAALVACAGLAAAATALGGARRTLLPVFVALGLAALAQESARAFPRGTRALLALRTDLGAALELCGPAGTVLAADVPAAGEALGPPARLDLLALPWDEAAAGGPTERVRRVESAALPYLLRLPEGEALRARGLALSVVPRAGGARAALALAPARGPARSILWRGQGRSDLLEVDPLLLAGARVAPREGASTLVPPRLVWLATAAGFEVGSIEGAWVQTDEGPRALFDLSRSLDWALAGTVRRVQFENQLLEVTSAELLPSLTLESLPAPPAAGGELEIPPEAAPRALHGAVNWTLVLVWPDAGRLREFPGVQAGPSRWRFPPPPADAPSGGWALLEARLDRAGLGRSAALPRSDL